MRTNHILAAGNGIALLGATGRSGRAILELCLARGIPVAALSRRGGLGLEHPLLTSAQGDARDPEALSELFAGRGAVVSALAQRRGEAPLFAASARAVIAAARERRIERFIGLTGLSLVLPSDPFIPALRLQAALLRLAFPRVLADRDESIKLIAGSGLDWTVLRLPFIDPQSPGRGYLLDPLRPRGKAISARDLAAAVLDILQEGSKAGRAPFAASSP